MDEKLRTLLEQVPDKPPRSKLEPHLEVIRELRRKGRTYQEIAQFFGEHLNVTVAASTIHAFVQVRARRRKQPSQIELPPPVGAATETAPTAADEVATAATDADVRERIEALKLRSLPQKAPKRKFEYNESEPLQIAPGTNQEG